MSSSGNDPPRNKPRLVSASSPVSGPHLVSTATHKLSEKLVSRRGVSAVATMTGSEHNKLLREIVADFEALAIRIEHAIEAFADDDSGTIDLAALHRARDLAQRGVTITRDATSEVRRAFD